MKQKKQQKNKTKKTKNEKNAWTLISKEIGNTTHSRLLKIHFISVINVVLHSTLQSSNSCK